MPRLYGTSGLDGLVCHSEARSAEESLPLMEVLLAEVEMLRFAQYDNR
jgi:hypothetical protein